MRRPDDLHAVGRGRCGHVQDHHAPDRVPGSDHGQEDGRLHADAGTWRRACRSGGRAQRHAPAAATSDDMATLARLAELRDSGAIDAGGVRGEKGRDPGPRSRDPEARGPSERRRRPHRARSRPPRPRCRTRPRPGSGSPSASWPCGVAHASRPSAIENPGGPGPRSGRRRVAPASRHRGRSDRATVGRSTDPTVRPSRSPARPGLVPANVEFGDGLPVVDDLGPRIGGRSVASACHVRRISSPSPGAIAVISAFVRDGPVARRPRTGRSGRSPVAKRDRRVRGVAALRIQHEAHRRRLPSTGRPRRRGCPGSGPRPMMRRRWRGRS